MLELEMNKYQNPYLKFGLQFPENWRLSFWGNSKNPSKYVENSQQSYDDLAIDESTLKNVFIAFNRNRGPSVIGRTIRCALFLRNGGYDINIEFPGRVSAQERVVGEEFISGKFAQTIYFVEQGEECIFYSKYYAFESVKNNWLCFYIIGDSYSSFKETKYIFERLEWF